VIDSSSTPYMDSLAQQNGLATQYYANTHPSIGNYFMLGTGQIITNDDSYSTIVTVDNVVRRLRAAGKTWKSYAEDIPVRGLTGGDVGGYARKHNTFALLSDVANDSNPAAESRPFTQFATDLANGTLPDYSNIVPNLCNDAHRLLARTADTCSRPTSRRYWPAPRSSKTACWIITFDEAGATTQTARPHRVGGREPQSQTWLPVHDAVSAPEHAAADARGARDHAFPGAPRRAPTMSEFFAP